MPRKTVSKSAPKDDSDSENEFHSSDESETKKLEKLEE